MNKSVFNVFKSQLDSGMTISFGRLSISRITRVMDNEDVYFYQVDSDEYIQFSQLYKEAEWFKAIDKYIGLFNAITRDRNQKLQKV